MIFNRDDAALVRAGKLTAKLYPASSNIRPDRTTPLRRRSPRHDPDGNQLDEYITATVTDPNPDGEPRPVVLTILSVDELHLEELKLSDANACGYRTTTALRDAWNAQHPRTTTVKLVRFVLGDIRDQDRYLQRGGGYTTSHYRAMDELAAIRPDEQATQTAQARKREDQRRKHPDQVLRDGLMRELEQWYESTSGKTDRARAQTIQGIRRQLRTLDRKLKEAA